MSGERDLTHLTIDNKPISAPAGTRILWAALDSGIYIPHLCAIREAEPPIAACRLCLVEIEGRSELVAACAEPVIEGMVVHTDTPRVARVRKTAFELLMSNHPVVCATCAKNLTCALQDIARRLGLKLKQKRFRTLPRNYAVDDSHPAIRYDANLCVTCGKCVWVCEHKGKGVLTFAFRGMDTVVATFGGTPLGETECSGCDECVAACPVGALVKKGEK
jgi:formate dehydrogenase major subunit/NADH-quinone oxidoreductase subunit G